jgi:uncharacterized membrane protein YeiH
MLYIFAISLALEFLPFNAPPEVFAALFVKRSQGFLAWMKIREVVIVGITAFLVAMLLIHKKQDQAKVDSFIMAVLALVLGPALRLAVLGGEALTWLEISDYLVTALGIPVLVAFIWRFTKVSTGHRRSG